jgi:hypothetical protein
MRNSEPADYSNPLRTSVDQRDDDEDVFGNQELLSRVDTLRELIVDDEGAVREGKFLHTFESEFFLFYLLQPK